MVKGAASRSRAPKGATPVNPKVQPTAQSTAVPLYQAPSAPRKALTQAPDAGF